MEYAAVTGNDSSKSGVSWAAVIAGAFVAAALSLALLALGTGIGLSAVSPWSAAEEAASRVGWAAIFWLVLTQLIACSIGGYMAGRLRTKWVNVHTHEVYFRDTAHGFLVWAVSLVIAVAFLTSAAASVIGGASRAAASSEVSHAQLRPGLGQNSYFADAMLRSTGTTPAQEENAVHAEANVILAHDLMEGTMPQADRAYLAQLVAARTGITESSAEQRVDDTYAQARQAMENARKALAHSMYWTFLALLVGAFCASFAATIGGRQRDRVVVI